MKSFVPLGVALAALCGGAAAHAQVDPLQARSWAAGCTSCHGTNGRAQPGMPALAGTSKEETLKKLLEFKAGTRPATIMHQLSKGYSDEQLAAIAAWFAAQKP